MNRKNFHKLIESEDAEYKRSVYQKIEQRLNLSSQKFEKKSHRPWLIKSTVLAAMALLVLSLATVIPYLFKNDGPKIRYCHSVDCERIDVNYTVKEYSLQNKLSILTVDWYDVADEIFTTLYVSNEDKNDLVYIEEVIVNGETGSKIKLTICDKFTKVDTLEANIDSCDIKTIIKGKTVIWNNAARNSKAYFVHNGYKYFLDLTYPSTQDEILSIIEAMLP